MTIAHAQELIQQIAGERTSTVNTKLRTVPAEFYPFIEEQHPGDTGVNIQVPSYHIWKSQPPPEAPSKGKLPEFLPAADDNHITLAGDRAAVQAKKADIEKLVEDLQRQLIVDQISINRSRHQHVIGKQGMSPEDFFKETGCAIILPAEADNDTITIIGRPNQTKAASNKVHSLVQTMQSDSFNTLSHFKNVPNANAHVGNLAQYLRERKVIETLERQLNSDIVTPAGATDWQFFSRDFANITNARQAITSILLAHPPSRFSTLEVDSFFHQHLQRDITPRVQKEFGVHVVTPRPSQSDTPVLLVFEGEGGLTSDYESPRGRPTQEQIQDFQKGLAEARKYISELIAAQAQITSESIDVPQM